MVNPTIVESHLLGHGGSALRNHSLEMYRNCLEAGLEADELREYRENTYYSKLISSSSVTSFIDGNSKHTFPGWI